MSADRRTGWMLAGVAAIVVGVLAVYAPALDGQPVWDDEAHMTRPGLGSMDGLGRIWFELGATQQYYPLTHSAFWLQHRFWGEGLVGHHLTNVLLHTASSVLVWLILLRLGVPGAWVAAAAFALHPVHVESVAWISELKNVLSGFFYLAAMLAYLRFAGEERDRRFYPIATALFVAALASKTVTATLPAAILIVLWWKHGRVSARRDLVPLLPWFAIGATAGLFTAWVEREYIGALGSDFDYGIVERCLIAGRAFWFYLGKLVWPAELIFIYPRWEISGAVARQYAFPLAAIALVLALWVLRHRTGRGPVAALAFFAASLAPALGFVDVYPFKFSFVADHFQYLASLGIIVLAVAVARRTLPRRAAYALAGTVLVILGARAYQQAHLYRNALDLWIVTTERNPSSPMAFNNLGFEYTKLGRFEDALTAYREAIALQPDFAQAHFNLGKTVARLGRSEEAIAAYRTAIEHQPDYVEAYNNVGSELAKLGRHDECIAAFRRAVEVGPNYAAAHANLGLALTRWGDPAEALEALEAARTLEPWNAAVYYRFGNALHRLGRRAEAREAWETAVRLDPSGDYGRLSSDRLRETGGGRR